MCIAGMFAAALLCFANNADARWDPEIPLTSTRGDIYGEGIATSGATVHVILTSGPEQIEPA